MIVVPVLMTSCHVSEKPKNGPLAAQIKMEAKARRKTQVRPTARDVPWAAQ